MIKQGQVINFKSVAQAANVSTAYLYKQLYLRNRIETLRDQQKQRPLPKQAQPASDNSKSVIISTLREENKKLRAEIDGLRRINEGLTGRLYQLQEASELSQRLKAENAELKQQLEECRRHTTPNATPTDDPKVTSLDKKRSKKSGGSDKIKSELDALNVKMNSTLSSLIGQAPEFVVLLAIETLKEARTTTTVRSPSGFLVEAIRNTWIPNTGYEQQFEENTFDEWYSLAKSKNLVSASTKRDGVQYVLTNENKWVSFEQIEVLYPLSTLQEMAEQERTK